MNRLGPGDQARVVRKLGQLETLDADGRQALLDEVGEALGIGPARSG